MKFVDEALISVTSGNGGDGCVSFRREKYVPKGGPDGGDGGKGGDIYIETDQGLNTLINFRNKKKYLADNGKDGRGGQMSGGSGEDVVIKVPVGTIVKEKNSGEQLADLTKKNQRVLVAKGGRGGLGNVNFKSSINQTPRYAQEGSKGETVELHLELKLLADIALIGLPNAGKSTLISVISAAKPKIADYPFTTLVPNLGVVQLGDKSFTVADIPGLIEDASAGKGLGIKFLKHIERTKAFVHLVDISWCLDEYEVFEQYTTVRNELAKYNPELLNKREIICLSKSDAVSSEEIAKFSAIFKKHLECQVTVISAVSGYNIDKLKALMLEITN